jgi:hypothetical protein
MKKYFSTSLILFTSWIYFAQNSDKHNPLHSNVKFNLTYEEGFYECEHAGCGNNYSVIVPTAVNSINKGRQQYVVGVISKMLNSSKDELKESLQKKCNNLNFRKCNYINIKTNNKSDIIELDASKLQVPNVYTDPVFKICFDKAMEVVLNFLRTESPNLSAYNARIAQEDREEEQKKNEEKKRQEREIEERKIKRAQLIKDLNNNLNTKNYEEARRILRDAINGNYIDKEEARSYYSSWLTVMNEQRKFYSKNEKLKELDSLLSFFEKNLIYEYFGNYFFKDHETFTKNCSLTLTVLKKFNELKTKPLNNLENAFVGNWRFKSKLIRLKSGEKFYIEEKWKVNENRTFNYTCAFKKGKETYFSQSSSGMLEIENSSQNNISVTKYVNKVDDTLSFSLDKAIFESISNNKSIHLLSINTGFIYESKRRWYKFYYLISGQWYDPKYTNTICSITGKK